MTQSNGPRIGTKLVPLLLVRIILEMRSKVLSFPERLAKTRDKKEGRGKMKTFPLLLKAKQFFLFLQGHFIPRDGRRFEHTERDGLSRTGPACFGTEGRFQQNTCI